MHKTHFGYMLVDEAEKQAKVDAVFHQVAEKYDLMNDMMSLGVHHIWKWLTIYLANIRPKQTILDLAGGSGDLSRLICRQLYPDVHLVLADINSSMLTQGRRRLVDDGYVKGIDYVLANAEALPFLDRYFDLSFMAFGLRNVTHKERALRELWRVTRPGGKLHILEFSQPTSQLFKQAYDWYSFHIIPKLGAIFANDADSYEYLVESIRMHPNQETLKTMIMDAGFDRCEHINLSGGIVALHTAYRY